MNLVEEQRGQTWVVAVEGRIDSTTAPAAETRLLERARSGALVVDLSGTSYVSSAGLRLFLKTAKAAKAAGHPLALCALPPAVHEVFDISGFTTLFTIRQTRAEAVG